MPGRSAADPRRRALENCVMQASARRLAESWRDRARHLRRYAPQAAEAWEAAASELERALGVTERAAVLARLLEGLRQEIVRGLAPHLASPRSLVVAGTDAPEGDDVPWPATDDEGPEPF
jgi:hypothetical protein